MGGSRISFLLAVAAGALLPPLSARAEGAATPSTRLIYTRDAQAPSCPEEVALKGAVSSRLGYDPFDAGSSSTVLVHVAKENGQLVGRIVRVDRDGKPVGDRTLTSEADDCRELADSMALALSIAIDPLVLTRPPRTPVDSHPSPSGQSAQLPAPIATPTATQSINDAPAVPSLSAPPVDVGVGVGAVGSYGVGPGAAFGAVLSVGLARESLSVDVEGRADLAQVSLLPAGTVSSQLFAGSLVPCYHYGVLAGCAVANAGAVESVGVSVIQPKATITPYAALGARLGVQVPLGSRWFVRANGEVLANLVRTSVNVAGSRNWLMPPFSLTLGVLGGARF